MILKVSKNSKEGKNHSLSGTQQETTVADLQVASPAASEDLPQHVGQDQKYLTDAEIASKEKKQSGGVPDKVDIDLENHEIVSPESDHFIDHQTASEEQEEENKGEDEKEDDEKEDEEKEDEEIRKKDENEDEREDENEEEDMEEDEEEEEGEEENEEEDDEGEEEDSGQIVVNSEDDSKQVAPTLLTEQQKNPAEWLEEYADIKRKTSIMTHSKSLLLEKTQKRYSMSLIPQDRKPTPSQSYIPLSVKRLSSVKAPPPQAIESSSTTSKIPKLLNTNVMIKRRSSIGSKLPKRKSYVF